MTKPLTDREKSVLYEIVKSPHYNDYKLAEHTNIKLSTVTAIRRRLKKNGIYHTIRIPNLQFLGAELLAVSYGSNEGVYRYQPNNGNFIQKFAAGNGVNDPVDVITGPDGNIYVSSELSHEVLRYDASGTFIDKFVTASDGGLTFPTSLAFGPDGNFYVASYGTDAVLRYDGKMKTGDLDRTVPYGIEIRCSENRTLGDAVKFIAKAFSVWVPIMERIELLDRRDAVEAVLLDELAKFTKDEP